MNSNGLPTSLVIEIPPCQTLGCFACRFDTALTANYAFKDSGALAGVSCDLSTQRPQVIANPVKVPRIIKIGNDLC